MRWFADVDHRIAAGLFAFSLLIYALTMSPTISFWDCAEFVTVAHTLGIPHQPGTPLYVLVGKVFSLLPLGLGIAYKINLMSAFFAALAVAFMYLTGVRLQRLWRDEQAEPSPAWIPRTGAAVGALFLAFSTTFWNSAIEAEVYSLASFTLAFVAFLSVYWYEIRERASSATLMLLIFYLMGMSVGFHMGSILVFPGVYVLVLFAERKALSIFDVSIVLAVIAAFVLSTMKLPSAAVIAIFVAALVAAGWRTMTWGEKNEIAQNRWFAFIGIALFLVGLSVHVFMMIRAHHDPLINQSDPTSFEAMLSVLRREQYPPRSIFEREAPLLWQIGHLLGTSVWQGGQLAGDQVVGFIQQFTFLPSQRPTAADIFVPTALMLMGIVYQVQNHWRLGLSFLVTLLVNSAGLLLLLNFTSAEVRDRDYFYFGCFQFAALFIGLGAGGLLRGAWRGLGDRARVFVRPTAVFLLALPLLPVVFASLPHPKWFEHDRSENWIAYHYGKNILASLPPDAILATNGDNDTFPLWYLQEVEGYRTDVRIVNLSLINLPWYIKQLRDYEPRLPIAWNDAQVDGREDIVFRQWRTRLEPQRLPDDSVAYIRDITMWHVVNQNNWVRPVYYAVTVPDENIGMFLPFLSMEGMVYRLLSEPTESGTPRVDIDTIWKNFTQVYDFTSVLDETGSMRTDVYRDAQSTHLLRNYPASLARVGWFDARTGNYGRATEALEWAYRMDPGFPLLTDLLPLVYLQQGRTPEALDAGRRILPYLTDADEGALQFGEALLQVEEDSTAVAWARALVDAHPLSVEYTQLLIRSLILSGDIEGAGREVDAWTSRSGDTSARQEFESFLREQREQLLAPDSSSTPERQEP